MKNSKLAAEDRTLKGQEDELEQEVGQDIGQGDTEADVEIQGEQEEKPGEPALELAEEEEELNTKYLRLAADFQNFRRRVEKEKNDIYAFANEKIMVELLNVIDNFDRALAVDTLDKGMKEGMAMILKQLINVLEKSGLEEIPAEGKDFDPNYHHAVQTENSETYSSGQVSKVLQKGYMLNKKVIRPTMVIVAE